MRTQLDYFADFLKVAPFSLALWRSGEAYAVDQIFTEWQHPVLDLGCGFGEFMGVFYDGQIEIGLDINNKDLIQAARTKKYRECKLADARHLPFADNSIGTIASISVLEHIPQVKHVFAEVYRVLKPGGHFIFTVPTSHLNDSFLASTILNRLRLGRVSRLYQRAFHHIFKHPNVWTPQRWQHLLQESGFQARASRATLTQSHLHLFELGLLPSLPSQVGRGIWGKRLIIDYPGRAHLLSLLVSGSDKPVAHPPLNIAILGVKP